MSEDLWALLQLLGLALLEANPALGGTLLGAYKRKLSTDLTGT